MKKPFDKEKVLSGVYPSGVVSGNDDGIFYPQIYSRYTGFGKTFVGDNCYSREEAIERAKEITITYVDYVEVIESDKRFNETFVPRKRK